MFFSPSVASVRSGPVGEPVGAGGPGVVPDVLGLLVLVQAGEAELAADAGLLHAAPLGSGHVRVEVVDPDRAVAQPSGDALGPTGVLGPDGPGEAVDGVVGDRHGGVLDPLPVGPGEGLDREHRAEGLVVDGVHVLVAVIEDRRGVVAALGELTAWALAAAAQ